MTNAPWHLSVFKLVFLALHSELEQTTNLSSNAAYLQAWPEQTADIIHDKLIPRHV